MGRVRVKERAGRLWNCSLQYHSNERDHQFVIIIITITTGFPERVMDGFCFCHDFAGNCPL